jgi:SOS response regulatory protein OraA/RecX
VEALTGAGVLDDARTAARRAHALADRGWGDGAVAARLEGEGFGRPAVEAAVGELEPESARATVLAGTTEDPRATWKLLARRGFAEETIEAVVGTVDVDR